MRPIFTHFLTAGLFLLSLQVFGQSLVTTFAPATANAPIGGTVALQLKVTNFTSITSLQLPITYNSSVLQFNSITDAGLPGFAPSNYNATTGKVTVSWYPDLAQYPTGFSLADNSSIFTMNFTVVGNGSSTVNIANVSPGIEVTRNNQVIQVSFGSGGANVTSGGGGGAPGMTISANTIQIPQGQTACMPVKTTGFTNVVSAAYAMHWDPAVLEYKNTQGYNLPDLGASNFNILPAGSNNLLMSWFEQALMGVTKTNGTTIYEVCFKAVGTPGTTSMITIDGTGFPPGGGGAEVINLSGVDLWTAGSGVADTIFVVTAPPPANAVTFTADKDSTYTDSMVCVDVRVKNFNDVISLQFGITYDPAIIQFKAPIQFGSNPLGLSAANFNTSIPGEIKFTWFDQNALGLDLPDSTVIFSICFTAIGAGGTTSPFNFVNLPGLPIEVVKEPGGEVTPALNNGHVHILAFVPPVIQATPTNAACNGSATGTISAILTQGGPAMNYSLAGPSGPLSSTNSNPVFNNLMPGTYTITVTVAGGITATSTAVVGQPAALSASISVNNATCNGGQTGAVTLLPSGGTAPYTYNWAGTPNFPGGATTQNLTGIFAGAYTVTITDTRGCTFVSTPAINVSQPTVIQVAASLVTITPVSCFGMTNGAISLPNATGGTGPNYTYAWTGPGNFMASTKNISSLDTGKYNLTVMDANMCTRTFSYTVTGPAVPLSLASSGAVTDVTCFGAKNGAAAVTVTGGTQPVIVSWRIGPTGISQGPSPTDLIPGIYTVIATDNNGCTAVLSTPVEIGGPTTAITANPTVQHVKCAAGSDGSITLAPAGGNGPQFSVQWSGGLSGTQINNLPAGNYTPTITDSDGCTVALAAISVNAPQAIIIADSTIVPQDGLTPGSITLTTVTGGTPPLSYNWTGPNGFNSTNQNISNLTYGIYHLTITDANGCTMVTQAEVTSTNILVLTTISSVTAACIDDGCITFVIPSGAVGPISLTLVNKNIPPPNSKTYFATQGQDTLTICNLAGGKYSATFSDGAGNSHTITPDIDVLQLQLPFYGDSRTNPFDDSKNGSITITPNPFSPNLTFLWEDMSTLNTRMNLDSGTYIVTITNATSGCSVVVPFTLVRQYQPFMCTIEQITPATCLNTSNGAVDISVKGADGPTYTYQWSGPNGFTANTQDISNVPPGVFICTVTDESNVQHLCPIATVAAQSQLAVTNVNVLSDYNGFDVSGASVCDGSAIVVFAGQSGTPTVSWSNSSTAITNNTLCGGAYTVTVTDQLGCTAVWQGDLTFPSSVVGSSTILSDYNGYAVSCDGYCDGRATVSAVGGVPPYRITWPTGQVDANVPLGGTSQANQLCGGEYKVTITDANNVASVFTFNVSEPDPLVFEFAAIAPETFTLCDGEVIATVPAGVGVLDLVWSTNTGKNGTGPRAENLCAGEQVAFVVQDQNGCTGVGNFQVPYPNDGCLQVRPIITPGSADGLNDYTLITCIEDYPVNTFEVYNRWGQLVYLTTGYNNGSNRWEGLTPGGQLLPDGVYFFVLKFEDDGQDRQVKGYINLLR